MNRYIITLSAKKEDSYFAKSYNLKSSTMPMVEVCLEDFREFYPGSQDVKVVSIREFPLTDF